MEAAAEERCALVSLHVRVQKTFESQSLLCMSREALLWKALETRTRTKRELEAMWQGILDLPGGETCNRQRES